MADPPTGARANWRDSEGRQTTEKPVRATVAQARRLCSGEVTTAIVCQSFSLPSTARVSASSWVVLTESVR